MTTTIDNIARIEVIGNTVQIIKNGYVGMSIFRDGTNKIMVGTYEKEIMKYHKDIIKEAMEMAQEVL